MANTILVVPCYNEADRLDTAEFKRFATRGVADLVLVNDGSRDATLSVLNEIRTVAPDHVRVVDLAKNSGKAEAVRQGLLAAVSNGAEYVGFWDADLATSFDALPAFLDQFAATPSFDVVMGSRVRLLGRNIERHARRHYAGRVFATAASLTLQVPVYDTQCGAKLFRVTPRFKDALAAPFLSKWVFDVELLARLAYTANGYSPTILLNGVCEYPLQEWRDVAGSKVRLSDFAKSALDLVSIYRRYISPRATYSPVELGKMPSRPASSPDR